MNRSATGRRAAIGLRAHSGWAALVALVDSAESPDLVLRRRIETADPAIRGSKQPFHAAEHLPLPDAEALIKTCTESTRRLSRDALRAVIGDLRAKGYEIMGCGVILGSGRSLPALEFRLMTEPRLAGTLSWPARLRLRSKVFTDHHLQLKS